MLIVSKVLMIPYWCEWSNWYRRYIAGIRTGKFQTDHIYSIFGYFRQLFGCNYMVIISDVLLNDKN